MIRRFPFPKDDGQDDVDTKEKFSHPKRPSHFSRIIVSP